MRGSGHDDAVTVTDSGRMPQPGDVSPGFYVEPMRCWRLVYDHQLQSSHCLETPSWTGRWFSPESGRWWRVWACADRLDGLIGLQEFGRSK